jgi:hypothetical protein
MEDHFYRLDTEQRLALVREAFEAGRPLMIRWAKIEPDFGAGWRPRAAVAAEWLAPAATVVDLGCGAMKLEGYLRPAQAYVPVDLAPRDERTLVLDLNEPADLSRLPAADACALLGVLEYSYAPDLLLAALHRQYAQIVMSFIALRDGADIKDRLANGWVNHFSREELLEFCARHGFMLTRERLLEGKRLERVFDFRRVTLGRERSRAEFKAKLPSLDVASRQVNIQGSAPPLAPVRASYFQRVRNIGDAVTPYLLENVAGRPTISARSTQLPYILSIGSLIQTSTPQSFIWGTGLIHPSAGIGNPDARRVLALRGKLTHEELVRSGIRIRDVPLGDPGFLIPRLLWENASTAVRFPLGLVPHYFDRDHPFFIEATKDPSVKVLDVCGPAEVFFADMASCGAIASTSLHGLIFGEALGLPTLWLEVSDKVIGVGFKFADWFSLARNPQPAPMRPHAFAATEIISRCEPRHIEIDTPALVQAITPKIIEECSWTAYPPRRVIPVSYCRLRPLPIFILSYNCSEGLRQAVSMARRQDRAVEYIVCDDGSSDLQTLALLEELEHCSIKVYRPDALGPPDRLDRLNIVVQEFFRDWSEPSRYAVTDCVTDLSVVTTGALDLYDDLLDRFPRADSVGPQTTRIGSDQPASQIVVNCKVSYFAQRAHGAAPIAPCRGILLEGGLDLGFAVYRAGKPLLRTMTSLRVCDML